MHKSLPQRFFLWLARPLLATLPLFALGLSFISPVSFAAPQTELLAQTPLKARMLSVVAPLETAIAALKVARVPEARGAFKEFEKAWNRIEDEVEKQTNAGHRSIENQSQRVEQLLIKTPNPDRPQTVFALEQLLRTVQATTAKL